MARGWCVGGHGGHQARGASRTHRLQGGDAGTHVACQHALGCRWHQRLMSVLAGSGQARPGACCCLRNSVGPLLHHMVAVQRACC
jgi:hypothetical protein